MLALEHVEVNTLRSAVESAIQQFGAKLIAMYLHGSYGTAYMRDDSDIDLAMHIVRIRGLGLPKDSKSAFTLLAQAQEISVQRAGNLKKMIGFRNIAVHDYRLLD